MKVVQLHEYTPLGPQKVKNDPKIKSKSKEGQNWNKYRKWKLYNSLSRPKTAVEPYPNPKNSPLGPQKVKNDPKIKSKSKPELKVT